jgi:hypothetical protein
MNSNCHPFYVHSGKFGIHGPLLALLGAAAFGFPLGIAYGYLIKWIPFIYLNALVTVGYGIAFGCLTLYCMKLGKVRNVPVAVFSGIAIGCLGWYFSWNGCAHALVGDLPWLLTPTQMWQFVKILMAHGSWGIGFSARDTVTGGPLAIVWIVEGGIIVGSCTAVARGIAEMPYCETCECWLDKQKTMDKLDIFTRPQHLEAFKQGDIAPLEEAQPRVPASGAFARLILRHSDKCHDYCALSVANVTITMDKKGNPRENQENVMRNLWVPKTMFDYLSKFDRPTAHMNVMRET